jgi:hypothetical protein
MPHTQQVLKRSDQAIGFAVIKNNCLYFTATFSSDFFPLYKQATILVTNKMQSNDIFSFKKNLSIAFSIICHSNCNNC